MTSSSSTSLPSDEERQQEEEGRQQQEEDDTADGGGNDGDEGRGGGATFVPSSPPPLPQLVPQQPQRSSSPSGGGGATTADVAADPASNDHLHHHRFFEDDDHDDGGAVGPDDEQQEAPADEERNSRQRQQQQQQQRITQRQQQEQQTSEQQAVVVRKVFRRRYDFTASEANDLDGEQQQGQSHHINDDPGGGASSSMMNTSNNTTLTTLHEFVPSEPPAVIGRQRWQQEQQLLHQQEQEQDSRDNLGDGGGIDDDDDDCGGGGAGTGGESTGGGSSSARYDGDGDDTSDNNSWTMLNLNSQKKKKNRAAVAAAATAARRRTTSKTASASASSAAAMSPTRRYVPFTSPKGAAGSSAAGIGSIGCNPTAAALASFSALHNNIRHFNYRNSGGYNGRMMLPPPRAIGTNHAAMLIEEDRHNRQSDENDVCVLLSNQRTFWVASAMLRFACPVLSRYLEWSDDHAMPTATTTDGASTGGGTTAARNSCISPSRRGRLGSYTLNFVHRPALEWQLLAPFLQPHARVSAKVTPLHIPHLLPWFLELKLDVLLNECDAILLQSLLREQPPTSRTSLRSGSRAAAAPYYVQDLLTLSKIALHCRRRTNLTGSSGIVNVVPDADVHYDDSFTAAVLEEEEKMVAADEDVVFLLPGTTDELFQRWTDLWNLSPRILLRSRTGAARRRGAASGEAGVDDVGGYVDEDLNDNAIDNGPASASSKSCVLELLRSFISDVLTELPTNVRHGVWLSLIRYLPADLDVFGKEQQSKLLSNPLFPYLLREGLEREANQEEEVERERERRRRAAESLSSLRTFASPSGGGGVSAIAKESEQEVTLLAETVGSTSPIQHLSPTVNHRISSPQQHTTPRLVSPPSSSSDSPQSQSQSQPLLYEEWQESFQEWWRYWKGDTGDEEKCDKDDRAVDPLVLLANHTASPTTNIYQANVGKQKSPCSSDTLCPNPSARTAARSAATATSVQDCNDMLLIPSLLGTSSASSRQQLENALPSNRSEWLEHIWQHLREAHPILPALPSYKVNSRHQAMLSLATETSIGGGKRDAQHHGGIPRAVSPTPSASSRRSNKAQSGRQSIRKVTEAKIREASFSSSSSLCYSTSYYSSTGDDDDDGISSATPAPGRRRAARAAARRNNGRRTPSPPKRTTASSAQLDTSNDGSGTGVIVSPNSRERKFYC